MLQLEEGSTTPQGLKTMSMLSSISDFSSRPSAIRRSIGIFARGVAAIANRLIAAIIAQRERQANLAVLRTLSDRDLRDMGLMRSQIGAGLAQAANDRSRAQNQPTGRP
jgi:uncharacterized protein YjiS (DUF1127 family)